MDSIKKLFAEEREKFQNEMQMAENATDSYVAELIEQAKSESKMIYNQSMEMDTKKQPVRGNLERINQMFNINIDFDGEWLKFLGITSIVPSPN